MYTENYAPSIIEDVYHLIQEEFYSGESLVNGMMEQVLASRGKGMRPRFMYLVASLKGGDWEQLRRAAMVIEAIHIASLLHDDVVDGSKLRRGVATLNSRYSDKISVLFGDYIFLKALSIAYSFDNPEIVRAIQRAVERMVEGEISDSFCPELRDEQRYFTIIGNKTASLFEAAGEVSMIVAGGNEADRVRARELGECVGMAFQIIDDALDYHGDSAVMGKPTLMDIRTGCLTLPLIHALREQHPAGEIHDVVNDAHSTEHFLSAVKKSGGIEYAFGRAEEFIRRAGCILDTWGLSESRVAFDPFFQTLLDRRH